MAQKLSQEVLEHFRLERDPFLAEIRSADDVYQSKGAKRAEWALFDAATHQYFVALVGPIGCGKTLVKKRVMERLGRDQSFVVAQAMSVEKEQLTAYALCEALIRDLSTDNPRRSREWRARQLGSLLSAMVKEHKKPVLVIDEAHALSVATLRALKRLYDETEWGFRRSLAILLIGQNTNQDKSYNLDLKLGNWDLHEVSERCQVLRLGGLVKEVPEYLAWKFERAGCKREIFAPDALKLLAKVTDVPIEVNNLASGAMIAAYELGKDTVGADVMRDAIARATT